MGRNGRQKGSVSLFIVIFSALLIITIGTAFIRIMIQGQSQATADDLSRSALDSANAGVEDVKRVIAQFTDAKCSEDMSRPNCSTLAGGLYASNGTGPDMTSDKQTDGCDATIKAKVVDTTTSPVVQVSGDAGLRQAYTCVKVQMNTDSYVGTLAQNQSRLVHLQPVTGATFDTVDIQWFSTKNLSGTISLEPTANGKLYPADSTTGATTWPRNRPSVMRTQLLQFDTDSGFTLDNLDTRLDGSGASDVKTLFFYPFSGSGTVPSIPAGIVDPSQAVGCKSTFSSVTTSSLYACEVRIVLPQPIGGSINKRDAYLRLLTPYNTTTDFQVQLLSGSTPVLFGGVQPRVDSTGRANDLYRRVRSYIEPNSMPYVEGALDISGDLCKAFTVGTVASDYSAASCNP